MAASYYDSNVPPPESNAILFDYEAPGRERAEWIRKNHFRRPLIYSGSTITVRALTRELESYGEKLDPKSVVWLPTYGETREKLPGIIRGYKPDCFLADGYIFPTFNFLVADVPELKDIPVYLDNSPESQPFRERYPGWKICLSSVSICDQMFRIGECAAQMMRLMMKKPGRFDNRKFTDFQS